MAIVQPFKAYRYSDKITGSINVKKEGISTNNADIHFNQNFLNENYNEIKHWIENKSLIKDNIQGFYTYFQYFSIPGEDQEYCRKGFIGNIKISNGEGKNILNHENFLKEGHSFQLDLLEKAKMNFVPSHGLYSDPDFILEKYLEESNLAPILSITDSKGVRHQISVIHDDKVLKIIKDFFLDKRIIIADGHHRINAAMTYLNKQQRLFGNAPEAIQYTSMYLSNLEDKSLKIFPFHRILYNINYKNEHELVQKLSPYFNIEEKENALTIEKEIQEKERCLGLITQERNYLLQLKIDSEHQLKSYIDKKNRQIDLSILQNFIFKKVLKIGDLEHPKTVKYSENFVYCLDAVKKGKAKMAIIVRGVKVEELKNLVYRNIILPEKSTFFYPKVLGGLIFRSIIEQEDH